MKTPFILPALIILCAVASYRCAAQCIQFINYPSDTAGWTYGSDHTDYGVAHYENDTFVLCTAHVDENNYSYELLPVTLAGTASTFTVSFDFRMDESSSCSDGLSFAFLTSGLSDLGDPTHEGGSLGLPDTCDGFALIMQTTVCWDNIYMKSLNTNNYYGSGPGDIDTDIAPELTSQMWLTDGNWHNCIITYDHGNITTSFDGGTVTMTGYLPLNGAGHFVFMGTNGGGFTRKSLKNISICAGLGTPTYASDSFGTYILKRCNGPELTMETHHYSPLYKVVTFYGDGTNDTATIDSALDGGYAVTSHIYPAPGNYSAHQVLYSGTTAIDSFHFTYENVYCATLPVSFYYDANGDCIKDSSEHDFLLPVTVEVDSATTPIDTISCTSGFYYTVHGGPGTVYTFKVLSAPTGLVTSCPASGIIADTIDTIVNATKYIGLNCTSGSSFDLAVHPVVPVTGIHDEWGDIYVSNTACAPTDATVTVYFSPKYVYTGDAHPYPSATTSNSLTWNVSDLTSIEAAPVDIHYQVDNPPSGTLTITDTVQSFFVITPFVGDGDTSNNDTNVVDTVRGSCDPNEMAVAPGKYIHAGQELQYTIMFENVGNDTAFNIYVMDTLSDKLIPSSLRIIAASSYMNVAPYTDSAGQHIIKFDFPHINLLDSNYHNKCNGMVMFSIKTLPVMADGTEIFNHAGVFFDDNGVVTTNTVENIVGVPPTSVTNTKPMSVSIYPNPAKDNLIIKMSEGAYNRLDISNEMGEVVQQHSLQATQTNIDIKPLPAGVYYVTLKGDNGVKVLQFIKM